MNVQPTFGTVLPDDELYGLKYIAILYSSKYCFYNKLIVLTASDLVVIQYGFATARVNAS